MKACDEKFDTGLMVFWEDSIKSLSVRIVEKSAGKGYKLSIKIWKKFLYFIFYLEINNFINFFKNVISEK